MKRLAILGSTGSIGQSALAVVDAHPDRLQVVGLAAGENAGRFAEQVARYRPRVAAMATGGAIDRLKGAGSSAGVEIAPAGREGLVRVATHPDVLGIGLDESTAIIVRGQKFEVVGASKIAIHDGRNVASERQQRNGKKYYFMGPGEKYDLTKLERIGKPKVSEQH